MKTMVYTNEIIDLDDLHNHVEVAVAARLISNLYKLMDMLSKILQNTTITTVKYCLILYT